MISTIHGNCPDCGDPVAGGEGVTVDAEGRAWHQDCRKVFNRKNKTEEPVKRGPGRPRKTEVAA